MVITICLLATASSFLLVFFLYILYYLRLHNLFSFILQLLMFRISRQILN
jgi:hypothetical protein